MPLETRRELRVGVVGGPAGARGLALPGSLGVLMGVVDASRGYRCPLKSPRRP